jgi:hypothetical protein
VPFLLSSIPLATEAVMKRVRIDLPADSLDLLLHFANEERSSAMSAAAFEERRRRFMARDAHQERVNFWADAAASLAVGISLRDVPEES